jgi:serine/threonine-protein kinase
MSARRLGRYEIVREIASGGMAKVYLGRVVGEGGFERLVALKVMHEHIAKDPEFVAMFLDEARLAARIRHPNVVSTLDIQKTSEGMFLVMDYVDGPALQDMRKLLKRERRRIPIEIAVTVVLDVLAGLHAAHDLSDEDGSPLRLVHRDVSPHNVLVGKDGIARLTDFGVARAEARIASTSSGKLKGKMAYMSPEQIMGQTVDRRSDVYAAGIVLWELLVNKRLFRADSEGELVHKILAGNAPWPHKVSKHVPLSIASVCMRALTRQPNDRFASAEELADALESASRNTGIAPAKSRRVGQFVRELAPRLETAAVDTSGLSTPASFSPASLADPAAVESARSAEHSGVDAPVTGSELTHTAAVLSMAPQRSRRGLIALVAVVCLMLGAGGALLFARSSPHEAATAAPPAPEPSETGAAEATGAAGEAGSAESETPDASASPSTGAPPPESGKPIPRIQPRSVPQPKPSPTNFRPSRL